MRVTVLPFIIIYYYYVKVWFNFCNYTLYTVYSKKKLSNIYSLYIALFVIWGFIEPRDLS